MRKLLDGLGVSLIAAAIIGAVHGMVILGWIIPVEILAMVGLYAVVYVTGNWAFAKEYRNEVKVRRNGR